MEVNREEVILDIAPIFDEMKTAQQPESSKMELEDLQSLEEQKSPSMILTLNHVMENAQWIVEEVIKKSDISTIPDSNNANKLPGTDLSDIVARQLQSSTDILKRLKMELNISPTRDTKNQELEEDPVILERPKKFQSYSPSPVSSSVDEKVMRNSMIEMKSGKKVKLRIKKAEKLDGSKILDMINKFKGPNMSSSIEISYSDNSQSESGNLDDNHDISHSGQEGPGQAPDTAALMAQLLALKDKELA